MHKIKAVITSVGKTFLSSSSSISRGSSEKGREKKLPLASSFSLKAKNIASHLGRKIFSLLKVAGILLRNIVTALSKKVKHIGKQEGKAIEQRLKKQSASSSSYVKTNTLGKEKGVKLGQLSKQLAIILGTKSYQLSRQAGQKIKYTIKQDNLYYNNLAKGIPETKPKEEEQDDLPLPDPETITQVVALNEKLAEELRQQVTGEGIECQAIEVNSLPIEYNPYYSYKFPMSPRIVTNRGCISVKGRKFSLVQIIQRN
jgi:hypothetical protein